MAGPPLYLWWMSSPAPPARVVLPTPADRLTVSANGRLVAATHLAGGTIALIDLGDARVTARITNLPPLRDVMFGEQVLYIAAEGLGGIGVIDVDTRRLSHALVAAGDRPLRLNTIAVPTLVVHGSADPLFLPAVDLPADSGRIIGTFGCGKGLGAAAYPRAP
jgi:pimeloyl-ACP methyl ester carboxylesterase